MHLRLRLPTDMLGSQQTLACASTGNPVKPTNSRRYHIRLSPSIRDAKLVHDTLANAHHNHNHPAPLHSQMTFLNALVVSVCGKTPVPPHDLQVTAPSGR